jgi:hypothetical protein
MADSAQENVDRRRFFGHLSVLPDFARKAADRPDAVGAIAHIRRALIMSAARPLIVVQRPVQRRPSGLMDTSEEKENVCGPHRNLPDDSRVTAV